MQADYYVNLHFNQAVAQKTGYAFKIGDKGCTFHFHCEDLNPSGMYPHIVFNHPNNTCVEGVPTGSGRDYAYTIQGNEFAVIGKTVVDLKFYDAIDATQRISTASFIIDILPDTYTDFEEASSSYADSLERAREEIDAAILDLQSAEHDLEEAETDLGNMSDQFADTLQDYIDAFGNTGPINPRGTYDDDTPYVPRDAVAYTAGGKTLTYINKQACTGIAPTDPDEGAAHWQIMIDVAVGGAFSALEDVSIDPQTLADGQVPVYNDTDDVWENKTILENSLTSTATDKALTAAKGKALQDNKQPKELETAITVAGTSKTTVETALDGINDYVDDSVEALANVYGSKNLLPFPYYETTKTFRGVTYTVNDDESVTCENTATNDSWFFFALGIHLEPGTYKLNGCPAGGSASGYLIDVRLERSGSVIDHAYDTGSGTTFTVNETDLSQNVFLSVANGTNVSGLTFKPMVYDARIANPNHVPFAMTNKQLTQDKAERKDLTTIFATGNTNTTGAQINAGVFFYLDGTYCKALQNIAANATFTENTNYKKDTVGEELKEIKYKKANINFASTDFAAQSGGLVAYKNIASDIGGSVNFDGCFVSQIDGVYSSCCCAIRGIDSSTTYLVAKTFDTLAPNVTITVLYH